MKHFILKLGRIFQKIARYCFYYSPPGICYYCGRKVDFNSTHWGGHLVCEPCNCIYKPDYINK